MNLRLFYGSKFKKGDTVWMVPIRFWEKKEPILGTVLQDCKEHGSSLYIYHTVYVEREFVFHKKENAIKAIEFLIALQKLTSSDAVDFNHGEYIVIAIFLYRYLKDLELRKLIINEKEKSNMEKLGATGKFPEGKINQDDEGELQLGIKIIDGRIVINFGKPVAWLGFPGDLAYKLANKLTELADSLTGKEKEQPQTETESPPTMSLERAKEINGACIAHVYYHQGLSSQQPPSLSDYSLSETIEAAKLIEKHDLPVMRCDERLLAALYVAYHYDQDIDENGRYSPIIMSRVGKGVFVIKLPDEEEDEEENITQN